MTDTDPAFFWSMSAEFYKLTIRAFIRELTTSVETGDPFPARLIVNLLPLGVSEDDAEKVRARGDFTFSAERPVDGGIERDFQNAGAAFSFHISDPVLKDYAIEIGDIWRGVARLNPTTRLLTLSFDPPLVMEIPRITEMGVPRSEFQNLVTMRSDGNSVDSELEDDVARERKTIIHVTLDGSSSSLTYYQSKFEQLIAAGGAQAYCGGSGGISPWDPEKKDNWYVYRQKKKNGACSVRQGPMTDALYEWKFGPGTKEKAEDYFIKSKECALDGGESGNRLTS